MPTKAARHRRWGRRLHHPSRTAARTNRPPLAMKRPEHAHTGTAAEEKRRTAVRTQRAMSPFYAVTEGLRQWRSFVRVFFQFRLLAALTDMLTPSSSNDPAFGLRQADVDTLRDDWRMRLHRKMEPEVRARAGSTQGRNQGTPLSMDVLRSMSRRLRRPELRGSMSGHSPVMTGLLSQLQSVSVAKPKSSATSALLALEREATCARRARARRMLRDVARGALRRRRTTRTSRSRRSRCAILRRRRHRPNGTHTPACSYRDRSVRCPIVRAHARQSCFETCGRSESSHAYPVAAIRERVELGVCRWWFVPPLLCTDDPDKPFGLEADTTEFAFGRDRIVLSTGLICGDPYSGDAARSSNGPGAAGPLRQSVRLVSSLAKGRLFVISQRPSFRRADLQSRGIVGLGRFRRRMSLPDRDVAAWRSRPPPRVRSLMILTSILAPTHGPVPTGDVDLCGTRISART